MSKSTRATVLALGTILLATVTGCTTTNGAAPTATVTTTVTPSESAGGGPDSTPTPSCGPSSGADAAADGIAALPIPDGLSGHRWDAEGADYSGYDACAALSWSVVTLDGSTPSSPYAILLFHEGTYLGTATKVQYPFEPDVSRASDTAIDVTYRYPQGSDANANPTGRSQATYTWNPQTERVDLSGDTPPVP